MSKILIVDDSETFRMQLRKDLENGGHIICEAENGAEGLKQLKKEIDISLIICDVNMPVMDGLTMLENIKNEGEIKALPVLMLTTESGPELKERGKNAGVTAWVTKPYQAEKVLWAIGKLKEKFNIA